jgi:hypothetical protein
MKTRLIKRDIKIVRNFKATNSEWEEIQAKANIYCNGNASEWIRYAAIHLDPKASDLVEDKKRK